MVLCRGQNELTIWVGQGRAGAICGPPQEVDDVLAEAERAGGTIVRAAARAEWGGTSGAFADPEGYVWEVANNPGWTLGEDGA